MEERKTVQIDYETLKKLTGYVEALSVRSWCCNEEIAKIYEKAIELGDGKAACNLGFMYQKGLIGKKNGQPDYEQAAGLYQRVIEQRNPEAMPCAMNNLALMLCQGRTGRLENGQPDYEQAAGLYQQVIMQENEIENTHLVNVARLNLSIINQRLQRTTQNLAGATNSFGRDQNICRGGRG